MPSSVFRPLPPDAPALLRALAEHDEAHPLTRTLLVAPAAGAGRELLRTLARARGGWTGFEVTTVRPLAMQVAVEWLASEGVRVADAFEEEARLDEALDRALDEVRDPLFDELSEGSGFRRAVRDALLALRLTGLKPASIRDEAFEDPRKPRLLRAAATLYDEGLRRDRVADIAGVLDRATRALGRGSRPPADHVLLLPGLGARGRAGAFLEALEKWGARRLATDPVSIMAPRGLLWPTDGVTPDRPANPDASDAGAGLPLFDAAPAAPGTPDADAPGFGGRDSDTPDAAGPAALDAGAPLEFFRAAGVHAELREVLRRVLTAGRRWDEVEIVTPDPGTYGPALHALCAGLDIETTFAVGLPVGRTRPGRAVTAWFRWIGDDCPSPVLRRLLQSGDLVAPDGHPGDSPWLARTLRSLRIGWGRERYRALIRAALERERDRTPEADRHRSEDEARALQARTLRNLTDLDRLMRALLDAAPDARGAVAPADVARGLLAFLDCVPADSEVDRSAHERLVRRLDRIAHALTRPTRFATALATVRDHLEIRVPAPRAEGKAPWLSDGGAVHLADLEHGGLTGRPLLFVVGLDAGRFPGGTRQDPFLLDGERQRLHDDLPVTEDRTAEQRFRLEALLARSRGIRTISYPAWEAAEARVLQPASIVLDLFRRSRGDDHLGYADLEAALGAPVSRIPRGPDPLDGDGVWLQAIARAGDRNAGEERAGLLDGRAALRLRHATLDRGLRAAEAPSDPGAAEHVGILPVADARRAALDPRSASGPRTSASALETLGACPLRYFYSRVLRVRKPDDPEFDLERWLPAAERGGLLHDVFQDAVDAAIEESIAFDSSRFRERALELLESRAERARIDLPPPSEAVFRAQMTALRADVRSFCTQLVTEGLTPEAVVATELELGGAEPVSVGLPGGGAIRLFGRADRVDRTPTGTRIVDYKTGGTWGHGAEEGTYHGGRRLQHVLYARALEAQSPELAPVVAVEYHFPTVRGENAVHPYHATRLADGLELVEALAEMTAAGRFPATDDPSDCRWCDYSAVCRFGRASGEKGEESAPRVEWTRDRIADGDERVEPLRRVREHGDGA